RLDACNLHGGKFERIICRRERQRSFGQIGISRPPIEEARGSDVTLLSLSAATNDELEGAFLILGQRRRFPGWQWSGSGRRRSLARWRRALERSWRIADGGDAALAWSDRVLWRYELGRGNDKGGARLGQHRTVDLYERDGDIGFSRNTDRN